MRNQLLRDNDWAGMAHSLEIRTPLVDFELLKTVASVVPHLKSGLGKRLIAQAPSQLRAERDCHRDPRRVLAYQPG